MLKKRWIIGILAGSILFTLIIGTYFLFLTHQNRDTLHEEVYDRYYVIVTDQRNNSLWREIYQGAYETGKESHIYVEMLGDNLNQDYSIAELMEIAIASKVDGIIVSADETEEMTNLINKAMDHHIPVVTVYGDNTQSQRCCFVGIGSYNLGREYGKKIIEIAGTNGQQQKKKPTQVGVIVNSFRKDYGQNILCSAIQETIEETNVIDAEITYISVDDTNMFSVEESIREVFLEDNLPDIIICLNELNTRCVYQAVIDYNKVGQVHILGYRDSKEILHAIEKNIIDATVAIETTQMGKYCVEALSDYHELGYANQYMLADINIIDSSNIQDYIEQDGEE